MVEGGNHCCQRPHGSYQLWCDHFSTQCEQFKKTFPTEEKEPQDRCDVPDCYYEKLCAESSCVAVPFMFGRGRALNPWQKTLPYFETRVGKDLVVEQGTLTLLRGKKTKWLFHNPGSLLRPLVLVPASRERVVPTEL